MNYWATTPGGGTYGKAKNSLLAYGGGSGVGGAGGAGTAGTSYVTYNSISPTPTNVSYPPPTAAASYVKPNASGKVTYYTQDWASIKQAQFKATGKVGTKTARGGGGSRGFINPQQVHYCEICKVTCGTNQTYKSHIEGAKHLKKAAKVNNGTSTETPTILSKHGSWKCVLCDIVSTSADAFKAHVNGAKHSKKVDLHKRMGKPIPEPEINTGDGSEDGAESAPKDKVGEEFVETKYDESTKRTIFYCTMCECSFMDSTAKEFHIQGRRHRLEYKKKYDSSLQVDAPGSKRQKLGYKGRGNFKSRNEDEEELPIYKEIYEAEQKQLESEWNQFREEERWYRYIEGIKRQEEDYRQGYMEERARCEMMGVAPPPPPPRPRPPPPPPARDNSRRLLENQDFRLIQQKHSQLQPSKSDVTTLEALMKRTETVLGAISDELDELFKKTPQYKKMIAELAESNTAKKAVAAKLDGGDSQEKMESEESGKKEEEEEMVVERPSEPNDLPEDHLVIKSFVMVGDLPKHALLKNYIQGEIILFCVKKPTEALFDQIFNMLKKKMGAGEEGPTVEFSNNVNQAVMYLKATDPITHEVKIILTSGVMRDEEVNAMTIAQDKSLKVLNRSACLNALAYLRQTKWFESRMSVNLIVVLQLLKDLSKRIPAWTPLSTWSLELIVERCARVKGYSTSRHKFSPAEVLRRVFELFASGFLLLDNPGLNDPCEKDLVDVLGYLSVQEREDLTASAQYALRLMVYNQLYRILGIAQPAPGKSLSTVSRGSLPSSFKDTST